MRGGKREGAGRRKGTPNKATADVKAAAQKYTTEAVDTLASIMRNSESDRSRVAAACELLDRGHGKPSQAHTVELGANERLLSLIEAGMARARRTPGGVG